MKMLKFTWDDDKNELNIKKHGVDFIEASSVFYDDYAVLFDDPDHSDTEDRFLIIGYSAKERLTIKSQQGNQFFE